MILMDKIFHQDHSGYDSVDESLTKLLVRDSIISHCKMFIESSDKIIKEHLYDVSISTIVTEAVTKDSSIRENLGDMTDSDLEIENQIQ